MITRRNFLKASLVVVAAPAIVKAENIMKVVPVKETPLYQGLRAEIFDLDLTSDCLKKNLIVRDNAGYIGRKNICVAGANILPSNQATSTEVAYQCARNLREAAIDYVFSQEGRRDKKKEQEVFNHLVSILG